jgi:hypothetical protein
MAVKKSVVVLCCGLFCRLRQCRHKLLLKRRNMPMTSIECGRRTRHGSSLCETSKRWCRPLSMPQVARWSLSHWAALSSSGGKLVTSATISGRWWRRWRRNKAICSTQGKSTASELAACERNARISHPPLSQIMLAGHTHGREDRRAAALPRLFAVEHDQFIGGSGPAHLPLYWQENVCQGLGVEACHQAAKGRLAGGRIAVRLRANAPGAPLGQAQALGELGQLFLSLGRAAQVGQQRDGDQTPQGIKSNALAVIGQGFDLLDQRANLGRALRAARPCFQFDGGQRGFELVGRQTAPGAAAKLPREQAFGFVVLGVKVAAHPSEAIGLSQFLPALVTLTC